MKSSPRAAIAFTKMHGCGNDFVAIDNRAYALPVERMPLWAQAICPRHFGVGADGLFFLDIPPLGSGLDYVWHFYNPDGSRGEMCGNGARCAARFAYELALAGTQQTMGTDAGPISSEYYPESGLAKVQLTPPHDLTLNRSLHVENRDCSVHTVNTGVPHAVVFVDSTESVEIERIGPAVRYHTAFVPAGVNVNFVQILDESHIRMRTYERGVEAETFACGTGACASVVVGNALRATEREVEVTTASDERLTVTLQGERLFLTGAAARVFTGTLDLGDLGLEI